MRFIPSYIKLLVYKTEECDEKEPTTSLKSLIPIGVLLPLPLVHIEHHLGH